MGAFPEMRHRPADAEVRNLADGLQIVVEHLVAEIGAVGDPDITLSVCDAPISVIKQSIAVMSAIA